MIYEEYEQKYDEIRERNVAYLDEFCEDRINDFLGEFFIRKCMWSTPGTIKRTAASIKKFYKFMPDPLLFLINFWA